MEIPLVVGVDGSDSSLRAVDWAVDAAARHGTPLRLVYASMWERYEGIRPAVDPERPWEQVVAEHIAANAAERARQRGPDVKISADVLPEDPAAALLRVSHDAFAVVTGSRGRGELAGMLLGSVSLAVAARAHCPVIVVRGAEPNRRGAFERIVLGVGEAADEPPAMRFAFREAEARGCELAAVRAWRCPAGEVTDDLMIYGDPVRAHRARAERTLRDALRTPEREHPEVAVRGETVEASARKALLRAAATADLLVVGAHRRHGHFGLQLGRVAHAVLHHAPCPVAIVPEPV